MVLYRGPIPDHRVENNASEIVFAEGTPGYEKSLFYTYPCCFQYFDILSEQGGERCYFRSQ